MHTYELMVILRVSGAFENEKKREEVVAALLGDGVKIDSMTLIGKKQLAYPIKKQTEGIYVLANVTGGTLETGLMQKRGALNADILRFLLIAKS